MPRVLMWMHISDMLAFVNKDSREIFVKKEKTFASKIHVGTEEFAIKTVNLSLVTVHQVSVENDVNMKEDLFAIITRAKTEEYAFSLEKSRNANAPMDSLVSVAKRRSIWECSVKKIVFFDQSVRRESVGKEQMTGTVMLIVTILPANSMEVTVPERENHSRNVVTATCVLICLQTENAIRHATMKNVCMMEWIVCRQ